MRVINKDTHEFLSAGIVDAISDRLTDLGYRKPGLETKTDMYLIVLEKLHPLTENAPEQEQEEQ